MNGSKIGRPLLTKALLLSLIMIVLIVALIFIGEKFFNNIDKKREEIKNAYIGQTVIVSNDTLIIVDYSVLFETCTLNNGLVISKQLVDRQLVPAKVVK